MAVVEITLLFNVEFNRRHDLEDWQEEHGLLADGIAFRFRDGSETTAFNIDCELDLEGSCECDYEDAEPTDLDCSYRARIEGGRLQLTARMERACPQVARARAAYNANPNGSGKRALELIAEVLRCKFDPSRANGEVDYLEEGMEASEIEVENVEFDRDAIRVWATATFTSTIESFTWPELENTQIAQRLLFRLDSLFMSPRFGFDEYDFLSVESNLPCEDSECWLE